MSLKEGVGIDDLCGGCFWIILRWILAWNRKNFVDDSLGGTKIEFSLRNKVESGTENLNSRGENNSEWKMKHKIELKMKPTTQMGNETEFQLGFETKL